MDFDKHNVKTHQLRFVPHPIQTLRPQRIAERSQCILENYYPQLECKGKQRYRKSVV